MSLPSTRWPAVILLWLCGIASAMQIAKISVIFEPLRERLETDAFGAGLILSGVGFLAMFLGLFAGPIIERLGYKKVLIGSMVLGAIFSLHQAVELNFSLFLVSRVLEGISMIGIVVAAPVLITRFSSTKQVSISLALWATFFGFGFALSGWIAPLIIPDFGIAGFFTSHALIMLILGLLCIVLVPNRASYLVESGESETDESVSDTATTESLGMFTELLQGLRNIKVLSPGLIFLSHTAIYTPILTFIPPLLSDAELASFMLVLLSIVSVVGTLISGPIAQYLLKPTLLAALSFGVMLLVLWIMFFVVGSDYVLFGLAIVLMFFSGLIQGAAFSAVPYLNPSERGQVLANSGLAQLGNIGSALGPVGFAVLASVGHAPLFFGLVMFCGIGVLIAGLTEVLKRKKDQTVT